MRTSQMGHKSERENYLGPLLTECTSNLVGKGYVFHGKKRTVSYHQNNIRRQYSTNPCTSWPCTLTRVSIEIKKVSCTSFQDQLNCAAENKTSASSNADVQMNLPSMITWERLETTQRSSSKYLSKCSRSTGIQRGTIPLLPRQILKRYWYKRLHSADH